MCDEIQWKRSPAPQTRCHSSDPVSCFSLVSFKNVKSGVLLTCLAPVVESCLTFWAVCIMLGPPIASLADLTRTQHNKLHRSASHDGSCYCWIGELNAPSPHNHTSLHCSVGFGVNVGQHTPTLSDAARSLKSNMSAHTSGNMSPFRSVSHPSLLGGGNVPTQVANRQKKVLTTVYEKGEQDHKGVLSSATCLFDNL